MKTTHRIGRHTLFWSCAAIIIVMQLAASAQTLVHEYSFSAPAGGIYGGGLTTNVADSVNPDGTWDGMSMTGGTNAIPAAGNFDGSGLLTLQQVNQDYVQLPAGILSNYTAVTIDMWVTLGTLPDNCFLYGFGDTDPAVLSGGQASGYNYIFCQPRGGRIAMSATDPGWQGEQGTGGAGDLSGRTVHITSVYNPPAGYLELYTNGVLVSRNASITIQMNQISNVLNYIGRSLYNADSFFDVNLDEFRIWDGALNGLQVVGCDLNGPDNPSTNYGTVTGIQLSVPSFQVVQGGSEPGKVLAQLSTVSYLVDISLLATYTSSNTNILTTTNNVIYAVGQGSANIVATYGSVSSTQTITVVQPASALTHRYSFSDANDSTNVVDSVNPGGAWDGMVMTNGVPPAAYPGVFSGGQLTIASNLSEYVQLPAGIISNYNAVTIEAWASFPQTLPGNCFFFGFGNTDGGGAGENYIYMQPSAGHIGITGYDPGWQGPEDTAGTYGNLSRHSNLHIAAVFNPQANWIAVYTNGVLAGKNISATRWEMNQVSSVLNYIARSLYTGDQYMDVNLDEFRIYYGALTSQGIAIADAAGTDSIPAAVTNGPGALLSLALQVTNTLQWLQVAPLKLLANYTSLNNFDLVGNSIFPPAGLSITSSDTNVVAYNSANGQVTGVRPGTATITASYQGITNSQAITVIRAGIPQLAHEYSFNDANGSTTVADSIGGPAWNGTVMTNDFSTNAGYVAPGNFTGSQLQLASSNLNFVQLPGGILSNYTAVTIEAWASFETLPANCFFFGFGATDTNGAGYRYIFCQPRNGAISITRSDPGWNPDQPAGGGGNWSGRSNLHVVAVFNPPAAYEVLYTNGVRAAANTAINVQMNEISNVLSYIARSLYTGDSYMDVSLDEFRIYNGVLSPDEIQATQVIGPNQLLTTNASLSAAVSGGNLTLSWPAAAAGFTLQSRSSLTSGAWTTVASPAAQLNGSLWQVTVPNTGGAKFFRLVR